MSPAAVDEQPAAVVAGARLHVVEVGSGEEVGGRDDPAQGYYVISGAGYELTEDTSRHRTLTPGDGTAENICETLS